MYLFTRGLSIKKNSLTCQGGHCWGSATKKEMKLPSPLLLGWCKNDDKESYSPVWKLGAIAIEACELLTKCNCSLQDYVNKCSGSCGW